MSCNHAAETRVSRSSGIRIRATCSALRATPQVCAHRWGRVGRATAWPCCGPSSTGTLPTPSASRWRSHARNRAPRVPRARGRSPAREQWRTGHALARSTRVAGLVARCRVPGRVAIPGVGPSRSPGLALSPTRSSAPHPPFPATSARPRITVAQGRNAPGEVESFRLASVAGNLLSDGSGRTPRPRPHDMMCGNGRWRGQSEKHRIVGCDSSPAPATSPNPRHITRAGPPDETRPPRR